MGDIEDLDKETTRVEILHELMSFVKDGKMNQREFNIEMNRLSRKHRHINGKVELIECYRKLIENNIILSNFEFEKLICKKPSRSCSGILSITLVMSPFPNGQTFSCKHNCYYCPNEPAHEGNNWQAQPRSYLYKEPAVKRANDNNFLAYEQMIDRMSVLYKNGHKIDKLEIILEGGTYTEYPVDYLEEYHRDIYYAANTFFECEKREKCTLQEEIKQNRYQKVHIIGICIETRPDVIDSGWIYHLRSCGVTRIQLGVQHTDNEILKKVNRGHTVEQAGVCIERLKNLAFKIDIHIMPDLPFTTVEKDKRCFDYVYDVLKPDQMKIYPCAVTPWTIIEQWYKKKKWTPLSKEELLEIMNYAMVKCPNWIRLPRVVRDIPNDYIFAGNRIPNLREHLSKSNEIRSREIERHPEYYDLSAKIFVTQYSESDYFISYESTDRKAIFGFVRLRLMRNKSNSEYKFLNQLALIRELHVYGFNTEVGCYPTSAQHRGIGKKLLNKAEYMAFKKLWRGVAVISGEGVKNYYSKQGYYEYDTYMIKDFVVMKCLYWIYNAVMGLCKSTQTLASSHVAQCK
mgnify:CR=1 FL=1